MAVTHPGDGLLELVRTATDRFVVVAPYIKSQTLRTIISALPESIASFVCVTRWLPEDIAAGVCDIEIFEDVATAKGGTLYVHPHLHAKYYASGTNCLVGSANLTGRGLGWHTPPNVELLVRLPADFSGLRQWEAELFASAIPATNELRDRLREEAARLSEITSYSRLHEVEDSDTIRHLWVPSCPLPERLWWVYLGRGEDRMVSSAFNAAKGDLSALRPPQGLTQELFEAYVAGILRQMPLIRQIDRLSSSGLTDAQAQEYLAGQIPASGDISYEQAWRILKLWLVHFLPSSYRVETGQEVLIKGKELQRR